MQMAAFCKRLNVGCSINKKYRGSHFLLENKLRRPHIEALGFSIKSNDNTENNQNTRVCQITPFFSINISLSKYLFSTCP